MDQPTPLFQGFAYASSEAGYTQIANRNFTLLAQIDNLSELKVTLYLMRNTWGYQEYDQEKLITTEEFVHGRRRKDGLRMDSGCGLKTTAVKEGLTRAIAHGYIACTVDDSDKGRIRKYYRLKMDESTKPLAKDEVDGRIATMPSHDTTVHSRDTTPDSRNTTGKGSQRDYRTEKETLETNLKKQTNRNDRSPYTPEEIKFLEWYARLEPGYTPKPETAKKSLPELMASVHSFEELQKLHQETQPSVQGKEDPRVYLASIVNHLRQRGKERRVQQQEEERQTLWSPYALHPGFDTLIDLWFLFELMPMSEARKYNIDNNGEMSTRKQALIRAKLEKATQQERKALTEQWIAQQEALLAG